MMANKYGVTSKFGIGEQVRHRLLGYLGVVIDVDAEYSLLEPDIKEIDADEKMLVSPWYHVLMVDNEGRPLHTYLAEMQMDHSVHSNQSALDDLAESVRAQLQTPRLCN